MSGVRGRGSCVKCHFFYKVVELVDVGSVFKGPTPSSFQIDHKFRGETICVAGYKSA